MELMINILGRDKVMNSGQHSDKKTDMKRPKIIMKRYIILNVGLDLKVTLWRKMNFFL